tara:strand:+ start:107 stop:250 length:144 start_codon:yes stop_codon:yes gene_type:complete
MNFTQKIFGFKSKPNSSESLDKQERNAKEVPVSKSSGFLTHTETTTK